MVASTTHVRIPPCHYARHSLRSINGYIWCFYYLLGNEIDMNTNNWREEFRKTHPHKEDCKIFDSDLESCTCGIEIWENYISALITSKQKEIDEALERKKIVPVKIPHFNSHLSGYNEALSDAITITKEILK